MPFIQTDFGVVHINIGRQRSFRCHFCNRWSDKLCDFPIKPGKTCDARICSKCATSVGPDQDHCPRHKDAKLPAQQGALDLEGEA